MFFIRCWLSTRFTIIKSFTKVAEYSIIYLQLRNNTNTKNYYIMKNIAPSLAAELTSFATQGVDDLLIDLFHQEVKIDDTFVSIELDEDYGSFRWSNSTYDNECYKACRLRSKLEELGYFDHMFTRI